MAFNSALSGNEMKKRRKYQRLENEKISLPDGRSSKVPKIKRILKRQLKITMKNNKPLKRIRDAYVRKMVCFAGCVVSMNNNSNPFQKYSEGSPYIPAQKPLSIPSWKCSYACLQ
ncbi:hypothetical protein BT93_F2146 [Corymbia citriodora subsp. variegata]|nr:hypothetical protein BT93_F2146 [Corymbia citriodora subsp. variegata]